MKYFKKLFQLFNRRQKFFTYVAFIAIAIAGSLEILSIATFLPVVQAMVGPEEFMRNSIVQKVQGIVHITGYTNFLIFMLVSIIIIFIIKNAYLILFNIFTQRFVLGLQMNLSYRLYKKYIYSDYETFFDKNTAEILRDIHVTPNHAVSGFFMSGLHALNDLLMVLMFAAAGLILDPVSTSVLVGVIAFLSIFYMLLASKIGKKSGRIARESNKKILKAIQQCFNSIAQVKVNGKESFFLKRFYNVYRKYVIAFRRKSVVGSIPKMVLETVTIAAICLVCLVNISMGRDLKDIISVLTIYMLALIRIMPSVNKILSNFMNIRYAEPFVESMLETMKDVKDDQKVWRTNDKTCIQQSLEFDDISYSYPSAPDKNVLNQVSLEIPANSFIGIVGRSGSGKSTLVALLVGLLRPKMGMIKIDGKPMDADLEKWQNNVGYIPQEIRLLDDSILSNVAYGENNPDIEKAKKALDMAQLTDFIDSLSNGLYTRVGQNGAMLSGGQKQRIGIARALYREAGVLVLDEATSSLDHETAEQFTQNIISLKHKLTIISISHKVETLSECDQVYKMQGGRLEPIQVQP